MVSTLRRTIDAMKANETWSSFWDDNDAASLVCAVIDGLMAGGDDAVSECVTEDAPETFRQDVLANYRNVLRAVRKQQP